MDLYKQRLNNALPDAYQELIESHDCWIAGGAILSIVMGQEVNDFDIYFKTKYDAYDFYKELNGTLIASTDKSLVVKIHDSGETFMFNLIIFKFFENALEIFKDFDFTCCKGAWTGRKFIYDPKFFPDVASRRIVYTPQFRYPIASLMRIHKYKKKGFEISRNEMLKIVLQITQHPVTSLEQLEEELGSHYGMSLKKIYPEEEDFSMQRMIEVLSDLPDDLFALSEGQEKIEEPEMFEEIRKEIEQRTFEEHIPKSLEYTEFNDKGYCIVVPACGDDIEKEGKNLMHCVGSYISSVLAGKSKIVFLRELMNNNESLVTVEIKGNRVTAAKGHKNRDLTQKEIDFLEKYCNRKGFSIDTRRLLRNPNNIVSDLGEV